MIPFRHNIPVSALEGFICLKLTAFVYHRSCCYMAFIILKNALTSAPLMVKLEQ